MPESVLVKFTGRRNPGITLRDVVNAVPYFAVEQGLLTVEKKNKKNIFNGCVIEIEGLEDLTGDEAYELTDASAERSAAACVLSLDEERVAGYLKSNVALMEEMIKEGYQSADTLRRRIEACRAWLARPSLLRRDANAEYKAVLEIDLAAIVEPLVACPNDPDDVRPLSAIAGDPVQEVFIGSCMTNIGQFRAAARILDKAGLPAARLWITPPTKMDAAQLMREGYYAVFVASVFSTSTRNFDHRLGDNTRVYLGSSELAALAALKGRIPTVDEYMAVMKERVLPVAGEIYRTLEFHKMGDFTLGYVR
jgi:aconitate hydratase 2/2-methylisocitrate dehydratase